MRPTLKCLAWIAACTLTLLWSGPAAAGTGTLVLPLRTLGVTDTTAAVAGELLAGELETRGMTVVRLGPPGEIPSTSSACDEPNCAMTLARAHQADLVVFGSLSRLGDKIIVRIRALQIVETTPFFNEQLSAETEEDLDTVMRRIAEGIAQGRPDAARATIDTITQEETKAARRREGRSGIGLRAGSIFPTGHGYADHRLTNLRLAYKYEGRRFLIESTALLWIAWGEDALEWAPLDIFVARVFGLGDMSAYLGGGLGMHSIRIERSSVAYPQDGCCSYEYNTEQAATTLSADLGGGVILLRTYSYQILVDVRFHYVFEDFDEVGGNGAQGFMVSFGTSH